MQEQLDLQVDLNPTFWDKAPFVKVSLNEIILFNGILDTNKSIKWSGDLEEGSHSLTIELYNKDKYQTIIENNKIVKDQLVNIKTILFDDIDISNLKWSLSKYLPNKTLHPEALDCLENCVDLGYNGVWTLPFNTPVYIWLLENI